MKQKEFRIIVGLVSFIVGFLLTTMIMPNSYRNCNALQAKVTPVQWSGYSGWSVFDPSDHLTSNEE